MQFKALYSNLRNKCNILRRSAAVLLFVGLALRASAADYASESVLSSGNWVKVSVVESGVYRITSGMLSGWGFGDISRVKVYGYGGAPISEVMGEGYIDDLPQVPVLRTDGAIYFYAQGPVCWEGGEHKRNHYATAGYYFITDRDDIQPVDFATTGEATQPEGQPLITDFTQHVLHEEELAAAGKTGTMLFGEDFRYNSQQTFHVQMPGKVEGTDVTVDVQFCAALTGGTGRLTVESDGSPVSTLGINSVSGEYMIADIAEREAGFAVEGETVDLTLSFQAGNGTVSFARLDYMRFAYRRHLDTGGDLLSFSSNSRSCRDSVFCINGVGEGWQVWDVTEVQSPRRVNVHMDGTNGYFRQTEAGIRDYVAFRPSTALPLPEYVGRTANQDIHGEETPTMLIITPAEFRSEAERVAELHRTVDSMRVAVVDQQSIFNEFSSGTPDAMAYRKIAKMWWDRSADEPENSNSRFRYLLLFGRSVFDNRHITSEVQDADYPMLLTWEWENKSNYSESTSFNSDDVFGMLEDGSDVSRTSFDCRLNIGIGRMPVRSLEEARIVVDKLYDYVTNPDMGSWKSRVLLVADDGNSGDFLEDSEESLAEMRANGGSQYVYTPVYLDAFEENSSGAGRTYPEARNKMFESLRQGVIYASYIGHANTTSWTDNGLLTWTDINDELFYDHLPLLMTATCEFSRWDDPTLSGGEILFLKEDGGAIAMITSSRQTGITPNGYLAAAIGRSVFQPMPDGTMPRLGDLLTRAKNERLNDTGHRMKYALLGDPAMRLKYPRYQAVVDEINGVRLDGDAIVEVQAMQEVNVRGHVADADGMLLTAFDGTVNTMVLDAEMSVTTHGYGDGEVMVYQDRTNRLYSGTDSVRAGSFDLTFRIPREINNNYTPGLIGLYAYSDALGADALGATDQFYVYGYDDSAVVDSVGPEIRLFALNTEDFANGDQVNTTPYLLVEVFDESGINISTAGVGHGVTLLLDGETTLTGFENYYTQGIDKTGYIRCQLDEMQAGNHTLRLRVWDNVGNMSEKIISFVVVPGLAPVLYDVYSDANPATTEANFYLRHDRPDAMITVTITVYNMLGQTVWTQTRTGRSDLFLSMPITWNLTDGTGRRVGRGIYLYNASVTADGSTSATMAKRIAVASE